MPNPKTVAIEKYLDRSSYEHEFNCRMHPEALNPRPAPREGWKCSCGFSDAYDAARAELAALHSRPSEKSVEECELLMDAAWKRLGEEPGDLSARHWEAIYAGVEDIRRAFLLDEEAGRSGTSSDACARSA